MDGRLLDEDEFRWNDIVCAEIGVPRERGVADNEVGDDDDADGREIAVAREAKDGLEPCPPAKE